MAGDFSEPTAAAETHPQPFTPNLGEVYRVSPEQELQGTMLMIIRIYEVPTIPTSLCMSSYFPYRSLKVAGAISLEEERRNYPHDSKAVMA
jgi:hypothetical protein